MNTDSEYIAAIEADLTAANTLCAELRTLRNFKKIAKTIPDADKMVSFDVLDKTITGKEVELTKLDSVTGKPVPGTEFTVKDGNGTVLGRYTTGSDGTVTVTGHVPGSTVVVAESKVPSGYVLNTTPQTIIVKNGSNSVSSGTVGGTTNVTPGGSTNVGGGTNGGNDLVFE